jgi:hypothetical protein
VITNHLIGLHHLQITMNSTLNRGGTTYSDLPIIFTKEIIAKVDLQKLNRLSRNMKSYSWNKNQNSRILPMDYNICKIKRR